MILLHFTDCDGDTLNRALVQYTFDNEEHAISLGPHGNSKKSNMYLRTMPSTLQKLRTVSRNLTPKFAVCEVSSATGDIISASSAGSLPRNRQQVSNMRRRTELLSNPSTFKHKDPLFSVMLMCKNSEGSKADESFVRIVTGAPEVMALLCPDWILNDLHRFCTGLPHTILTLDPTFDLGEFNVTVSTYRHLMLVNSAGNHPVMSGPIFVHQRKQFQSYYFFASSLLGLKPSLSNLCAFGTDGEKALFSAFQTVFSKAIHLRYFLHFRGNLDAKLKEYGIPQSLRIEFLRDVFGNPESLEDGLVDIDDDDMYEASVCSLKKLWNDRELPFNNPPKFFDWFVVNCKEAVKATMLKKLRVAAGLGNPPQPYYTNDVECHNNVIKQQTNYRAQELPQFIESMKKMIENQKKEIERAIVGMGEYRLSSDFCELQVDTRKFFQKSEAQREKLIKRFFTAKYTTDNDIENLIAESSNSTHDCSRDRSELDSTVVHDSGESDSCKEEDWNENPLLQLSSLPRYVAEKIWTDSLQLASSTNSVCVSPGCNDGSAWLVQSSTNQTRQRPIFVECKKNGHIVCEQSCMLFHSCNICAHTVAVAKHKYCLDSLLESILKKQKGVNVTKMSNTGMPKSCGRKPGAKRKASLKSSTKRIRSILEEAGDESRTPRIKVTTKKKCLSATMSSTTSSTTFSNTTPSLACTSEAANSMSSDYLYPTSTYNVMDLSYSFQ